MNGRFLIVRLGAVGDVVHALPLASAIRDAYPNAHIAWAVAPGTSPLLEENPDINQVFIVDTKAWRLKMPLEAISGISRCISSLREIRANVAIDAQGLIKSGLIVLASGAGKRVGFEQRACREGLSAAMMTHHAPTIEGPHHVIEKNLSLLGHLGVEVPMRGAIRFPLPERTEEAEEAASFLQREGLSSDRPLMIAHPGAGWETKRWDTARYAVLGDSWVEMSGGSLLFTWGSEEEEATVRRVVAAMHGGATVAPRTSLRQLSALLRRADVFVGGDSGPLHLAAALGVRCLAIIGATDPLRNGPWGEGHEVLHHRLACSGCYGRTCPDIECLDRIGADEAILALKRLWNSHE